MGSLSIWHLVIVVLAVGFLVAYLLYCQSYKSLLSKIDEKFGRMSPNLAYLLIIPILGTIWQLILLFNVKNALVAMQKERSEIRTDGGFYVGIALVISQLLMLIPDLSIVMTPLALVLWIVLWKSVVNARTAIG